MAVDYEVICRQGDLGSLLAAAFLAKEKCRIMLLPPLSGKAPEPNFLIPVVRGYPARLLATLIELKSPPTGFFSWQSDSEISSWPGLVPTLAPEKWLELEEIWRQIDICMLQGLEMPTSSPGGIWRMLVLLVRNQLLRESRHRSLVSWFEETGIPLREQPLWRSLVPLISLGRFADPPLLSLAFGLQILLAPDAWIEIGELKTQLLNYLLSQGAHQVDDEWSPVFDGKWYIGVGNDGKVIRRSTVFLADSDPHSLQKEVPPGLQRRDFKRQFQLDDPGYIQIPIESEAVSTKTQLSTDCALYHLDCRGADDFLGSMFFVPESENGQGSIGYSWQIAGEKKEQTSSHAWGWEPRLPAMMGGSFLPLTGSLCRFYQVGWHNLPGFGLGGLVYSARQTATAVLRNELKR